MLRSWRFLLLLVCYAAILFFHKHKFPALSLPSIVYPIAFGTRMLNSLHYLTGNEWLNPALICEQTSLGGFSLIGSRYTEMFGGKVLRISSSAENPVGIPLNISVIFRRMFTVED